MSQTICPTAGSSSRPSRSCLTAGAAPAARASASPASSVRYVPSTRERSSRCAASREAGSAPGTPGTPASARRPTAGRPEPAPAGCSSASADKRLGQALKRRSRAASAGSSAGSGYPVLPRQAAQRRLVERQHLARAAPAAARSARRPVPGTGPRPPAAPCAGAAAPRRSRPQRPRRRSRPAMHSPLRTRKRRRSARRASSSSSRVLPMPLSPPTSTSAPWPVLQALQVPLQLRERLLAAREARPIQVGARLRPVLRTAIPAPAPGPSSAPSRPSAAATSSACPSRLARALRQQPEDQRLEALRHALAPAFDGGSGSALQVLPQHLRRPSRRRTAGGRSRSSYRMHPSAYRSARASTSSPRICSGAMVLTVPAAKAADGQRLAADLAAELRGQPEVHQHGHGNATGGRRRRLGVPGGTPRLPVCVTRTLSGFRSRCTRPSPCRYAKAPQSRRTTASRGPRRGDETSCVPMPAPRPAGRPGRASTPDVAVLRDGSGGDGAVALQTSERVHQSPADAPEPRDTAPSVWPARDLAAPRPRSSA